MVFIGDNNKISSSDATSLACVTVFMLLLLHATPGFSQPEYPFDDTKTLIIKTSVNMNKNFSLIKIHLA